MNDRIKEIAVQAGYTPLPGFAFANNLQEVFIKKFAELIVKECIDIAYQEGDNVAYLALHFGVEE